MTKYCLVKQNQGRAKEKIKKNINGCLPDCLQVRHFRLSDQNVEGTTSLHVTIQYLKLLSDPDFCQAFLCKKVDPFKICIMQ
jgi:hypothetical protein